MELLSIDSISSSTIAPCVIHSHLFGVVKHLALSKYWSGPWWDLIQSSMKSNNQCILGNNFSLILSAWFHTSKWGLTLLESKHNIHISNKSKCGHVLKKFVWLLKIVSYSYSRSFIWNLFLSRNLCRLVRNFTENQEVWQLEFSAEFLFGVSQYIFKVHCCYCHCCCCSCHINALNMKLWQ